MPTMLRHKTTGELWPYNPDLARHESVEEYVPPDDQFAAAKQATAEATVDDVVDVAPKRKAPKRKAAPKKVEAAESVKEEPASEPDIDDVLADLSLDDD